MNSPVQRYSTRDLDVFLSRFRFRFSPLSYARQYSWIFVDVHTAIVVCAFCAEVNTVLDADTNIIQYGSAVLAFLGPYLCWLVGEQRRQVQCNISWQRRGP